MRDADEQFGSPTNGETDGDDVDIYRKAADINMVELSSTAMWLFRKTVELVEAIMYALPSLSGTDSDRARVMYDKYSERLYILAKLAVLQQRELAEAAKDIADLLTFSNAPEAKNHAEKLKAVLKGRKSTSKPPRASG
jgi:hypothetical protein